MGTSSNSDPLDLTSDESLELGIRLTRGARRLLRDLVRVREQRDYSKSQVAGAIGIHKSGVTRFERQSTDPRLATLLRYAHAVGADVSFHVEPVGGWHCEDSAIVTRLGTWKADTATDHGADTWHFDGKISLAR